MDAVLQGLQPEAPAPLPGGVAVTALKISGRQGGNEAINGVYVLNGCISGGLPVYIKHDLLLAYDIGPQEARWVLRSINGQHEGDNIVAFCPCKYFGRWWRVAE